jgi:ribosomal protein S3AE
MSFFEGMHDKKKFIIMIFIIYFSRRKITRMEIDKMKKVIFPSYESMAPNVKLEMFVSKINGLEGSA